MNASLNAPDALSIVGSSLQRLRRLQGRSLASAADAANVSKSALAHWEAGRRCPPGPVLDRMLGVLAAGARERSRLLALADPRHARLALEETTHGAPVGTGEFLRAVRLSHDLKQSELALVAGANQGTVARWERGDLLLSVEQLREILERLGGNEPGLKVLDALDPLQPTSGDLEERYQRIAHCDHRLGETLWVGLEADLWWRATESPVYDQMLQTVMGHRADWYALSLRPQETLPLARRAIRFGFGPPSDVPQGIAYGIVYATLQARTDPVPSLRLLREWSARLKTPASQSRVGALRALLVAELDVEAARAAAEEAVALAKDDAEAIKYANLSLARIHLRRKDPESALRALEDDEDIDAVTLRALALAQLGRTPPERWMAAIRERRATIQIPLYRERLREIERTLARLGS